MNQIVQTADAVKGVSFSLVKIYTVEFNEATGTSQKGIFSIVANTHILPC